MGLIRTIQVTTLQTVCDRPKAGRSIVANGGIRVSGFRLALIANDRIRVLGFYSKTVRGIEITELATIKPLFLNRVKLQNPLHPAPRTPHSALLLHSI